MVMNATFGELLNAQAGHQTEAYLGDGDSDEDDMMRQPIL